MGRPKKFCRTDILCKVIPLFWKKGFADTALQDIEKATGVNKSGLYSEFKDKEDIFVQSLSYYLETRDGKEILSKQPLGWNNIETFLTKVMACAESQGGCFSVSTMRDLTSLPSEANELVNKAFLQLKKAIATNIAAEETKMDPTLLAEMVVTFYTGICFEQNLKNPKNATNRKIEDFLKVLKNS
jgi:AcrR family transcriptional regulator